MARIVRYLHRGEPAYGLIEGETVYALRGDPFGSWERGEAIGPAGDVRLLAPVQPTKLVCVGRNYAAHAAEHGASVPSEPLLFLKPPSAVIGPGDPIVLPVGSQQVEHEAELALVIGRRCRNVSPEEAWDYLLGVTCANDVTARDWQRQDDQWTRAKGFDTSAPLGPWIVTGLTPAEVGALEVVCRVNGQERQRGNTGEMVFGPAFLISYISRFMTLEPGDVVLTGTPAGVAPLQPGDQVEVEIEGIGRLRNPVRAMGEG